MTLEELANSWKHYEVYGSLSKEVMESLFKLAEDAVNNRISTTHAECVIEEAKVIKTTEKVVAGKVKPVTTLVEPS